MHYIPTFIKKDETNSNIKNFLTKALIFKKKKIFRSNFNSSKATFMFVRIPFELVHKIKINSKLHIFNIKKLI